MMLGTIASGIAVFQLRATRPGLPVHTATIEAATVGTRELAARLRTTLRRRAKLTLPILRLRPMREIPEILRPLRTTLEAGSPLHPRTLRSELRTVLREAASLLRSKASTVMAVHPGTLRAKLRVILREALATRLGTKVLMLHARPLRTILRELLPRLARLAWLLRTVVLRLPLLLAALKALRHLVLALHLPGKPLAHLALESLLHLRLKLLAPLHPGLRPAIAALALRSLRRSARCAGLRSWTLRPHILAWVSTRCLRSTLVK